MEAGNEFAGCHLLHLALCKCKRKRVVRTRKSPPPEKGAARECCRFIIENKNKLSLGEGYYRLLIIINMFGNIVFAHAIVFSLKKKNQSP